jgi:hypothetical protein
MAKLSKAQFAGEVTKKALRIIAVTLEPAVQKSWNEAGRSTLAAVRETVEAWKLHR